MALTRAVVTIVDACLKSNALVEWSLGELALHLHIFLNLADASKTGQHDLPRALFHDYSAYLGRTASQNHMHRRKVAKTSIPDAESTRELLAHPLASHGSP